MRSTKILVWLRQDLRLRDNPALHHAAKLGQVVLLYIHDEQASKVNGLGEASCWWLQHSLKALHEQLDGRLNVFRGRALTVINKITEQYGIEKIYWNRCYEPWRIQQDREIKSKLKADGLDVKSFNASLLWEPWEVLKQDQTPYKVFTPFYKKGCLMSTEPRKPLPKSRQIEFVKLKSSLSVEDLSLLPHVTWYRKLHKHWQVGELNAHKRLKNFLSESVYQYKKGRDLPAIECTSKLSPHLHFGEISPHTVWHGLSSMETDENLEHFKSELAWREFSYYLLYHFPILQDENFKQNLILFRGPRMMRL